MGDEARRAEAAPDRRRADAGRQAPDLPPILTVDELADFLRLNRKTVYEAVSRGEIPGVRRIGHTFRISRDAVLQWLRRSGRLRLTPAPCAVIAQNSLFSVGERLPSPFLPTRATVADMGSPRLALTEESMSVRRRSWTDPVAGKTVDAWFVDVKFRSLDGREQRIRKFSPVQTKRGAEQYEQQLRQSLLDGTYGQEEKEVHREQPTLAVFAKEFIDTYAKANNKPSEVQTKQIDPEDAPRAGDGIPQAQRDRTEEDRDLQGAQARERVVTEDGEQPPHGPSPPALARSRVGTARSPSAVQVAEGPGSGVRLPRLRGGRAAGRRRGRGSGGR